MKSPATPPCEHPTLSAPSLTNVAAPRALVDAAVEINRIPEVDDALPVLIERALDLLGADSASLITWEEELREGVVRAAAGIAPERTGERVVDPDDRCVAAARSGRPQWGPLGPTGFSDAVEAKMASLRCCVSVPISDGAPTTIQASWLAELPEEQLAAAADLLELLAGLTGIANRAHGERARRHERARIDAVFEAAADGIVLQRDGVFEANPAAQRLLALPDSSLPPIETLDPRLLDGTPISTGGGLPERFRIRVTNLAGEPLVLDGSYSAEPVPVAVFHDVTEQYRREYATAAYLRALLDAIPTPISCVDAATRTIVSVNAAFLELVGLAEHEAVGAVPPYPWWGEGERLRELAGGSAYGRIYRHADGRPIPVELELREVRDADGRVSTYLGVITDLTERRRFQQQLVQSGKLAAIGELSAGVAHEINNPLFAILGLVEFLLKDAQPGTKAHERLELIQTTAHEIKQITRALLDFARESSDERRVVALDEVVRETVELIRRTSASKGIEIEESFGDGMFLVDGSPNQLKQIVLNLLANARQAMPGGGRISIRVCEDAEHVVATVTDTGPGIDADLLQRIFEPFFTTKRSSGGTGLGLSVSVGIAESHGGSLTASSEPGAGASFTLRLPRYEAADA
jgi:PAS domain S-box-containing protein